jgi:hypothetical protein
MPDYKKRAEEWERTHGKNYAGPEEAGAEEGDITDYLMPVKGLTKKVLRNMAEKAGEVVARKGKGVVIKHAAKKGADKATDRKQAAAERNAARREAQAAKQKEADAKREASHKKLDEYYGSKDAKTKAARKEAEEKAPTIDYSKFKKPE